MTELAHALATNASPSPNIVSVERAMLEALRGIFPEKTAAHVATITRTTVRAAEYLLSGRSRLSFAPVVYLLRSPIGPKVLDAITDGAEWRACERRLIDIYELQNQLKNIEQKRRALERALVGPR